MQNGPFEFTYNQLYKRIKYVLELAGIKDVLTKSLGSRNPINVVNATIECLKQLSDPEKTALDHGKKQEDLDLPKQSDFRQSVKLNRTRCDH